MGSAAGLRKQAAQRIGVTPAEYAERLERGEKWCTGCKAWHDRAKFSGDRSRGDGLKSKCRAAGHAAHSSAYVPKARPESGRRYVDPRSGDVRQARRRVNHLVQVGRIPAPNTLPCADCAHVWTDGERRHEYDHHLGYQPDCHEAVEAVCTTCHHARETARRAV